MKRIKDYKVLVTSYNHSYDCTDVDYINSYGKDKEASISNVRFSLGDNLDSYEIIDCIEVIHSVEGTTKGDFIIRCDVKVDKYNELRDIRNGLKANGNLAMLINLNSERDEDFDFFFNGDMAEKYINYEELEHYAEHYSKKVYEENKLELMQEISEEEIIKRMDEEDMERYSYFLDEKIFNLEKEIEKLREEV